jgi:predicted porin
VDISANLQHTLENGNLSLGYARSQTAVIGQAGTVDTRTYTALLDLTFVVDYEVQISPSYTSDRTGSSHADVTRLDFNLSYKLGKDVALVGSYQYNRQRGLLGGIGNPEIRDNVVYVGLVFSFPTTTGNFAERRSSPFETLWPAPRH